MKTLSIGGWGWRWVDGESYPNSKVYIYCRWSGKKCPTLQVQILLFSCLDGFIIKSTWLIYCCGSFCHGIPQNACSACSGNCTTRKVMENCLACRKKMPNPDSVKSYWKITQLVGGKFPMSGIIFLDYVDNHLF